ncbi:MAG TPA: alkaline phosphatase family protein [Spirillospora sp.]|nr:alkaline phosphatase family protein [Spirillospora sp.]
MPFLTDCSITFDTHGDDKDFDTVLHVFVKNRQSTTATPNHATDFASDLFAFQDLGSREDVGSHALNPYIAVGINLVPDLPGADTGFDDPSSHTLSIPTFLTPQIQKEDIVLPEVSIHIQPNGRDTWIFDYTLTLTFSDQSSFAYSSTEGGSKGIMLDEHNLSYCGITTENPLITLPTPDLPAGTAVLESVTVDFLTHDDDDDDNKDHDTRVDLRIRNRVNATTFTDIVDAPDILHDHEFPPGSLNSITFSAADPEFTAIRMSDVILPVVDIDIAPHGHDKWKFDYRVTFRFTDPVNLNGKSFVFDYRTGSVVLDQVRTHHSGVYQGDPFPTVTPRTAPPLTNQPIDRVTAPKLIPTALLKAKLDEFINNRNLGNQPPPLRKIQVTNTGRYNAETLPESVVNVRAIKAVEDGIGYSTGPISLGQLTTFLDIDDVFFNVIDSDSLTISVDPRDPAPFTVKLVFDCSKSDSELITGLGNVDVQTFDISVRLTLFIDLPVNKRGGQDTLVDAFGWAPEILELDENKTIDHVDPISGVTFFRYRGNFLGEFVDVVSSEDVHKLFLEKVLIVHFQTGGTFDPGGTVRQNIRDMIFKKLTDPDKITGRTRRDQINSLLTSWLLGGTPDDEDDIDGNNTVLQSIGFEGTDQVNLGLHYTGPPNRFAPAVPADFPAAWDFSQGTLSNIHHIVVLMMENRSFDHMLGYLSLPVAGGGAGRSDVDGLKGGESNPFNGQDFPSFPLTGTFFSPDPPHGYEPTHRAINGGKMDGFVRSWVEQNGPQLAAQIMGHHTAQTVPTYDQLARDFAVGHRWFASHPGPTFPNRFYELTGRPNLDSRGFWEFDDSSPLKPVFTETIFDLLPEGVSWVHYEQGYTFLRFFEDHTFDNEHIVDLNDPERGFFVSAAAGTLPNVTFIDPHFIELPPGANADGPIADVKDGQKFVESVVNAVVSSPNWDDTLLLIVYDEHGGFYDHVPPSPAARVSPEIPVDTHGIRVPAFVISPYVTPGSVFGADGTGPSSPSQRGDLHFDHTSILKTIVRTFMSDAPPYLGARYAQANDLSSVITATKHNAQFRPFIPYTFTFNATSAAMGPQGGVSAPGAAVWQLPADGTTAQSFAFEAAPGGAFFIRSKDSDLYLTLVPPATPGPITHPNPSTVIEDVKHAPADQARQKWVLVPAPASTDLYLVESTAQPGKILQPSDPTTPGPLVVAPSSLPAGLNIRLAWKVVSPLLPA